MRLGFSLGEIRDGLSEAAPNFPSRDDQSTERKVGKSRSAHRRIGIEEVQARRRQVLNLLEEMDGERNTP